MVNNTILWPVPQKIKYFKGTYKIRDDFKKCILEFSLDNETPDKIAYSVDPAAVSREEGYILKIGPKGINIISNNRKGLYYAIATLKQLITKNSQIPCMEITDWPDIKNRAVMLDISRDKVPLMSTIYGLIDIFAGIKINQFQLYTEHTFAYSKHKKVWGNASPITPEEIREIDKYCKARCIQLVPNQNSFGHMERWLKHEEYKHLAEIEEGFMDFYGNYKDGSFSLCPIEPESIKFLNSLYNELLPNFSSSILNIGCDETFDLGQGRSKEDCRRIGTERVYLNFLLKIYKLLKEKNIKIQFWGDIVLNAPKLIKELHPEIEIEETEEIAIIRD